ncbi:MAG: WD40 repeat domain-containing protein [Spirochaetaceae bacterium]|jgi:WD40 repeat protein|nr:WD40 repeat domain-containing protein [Spirochaetaceae bacterium]
MAIPAMVESQGIFKKKASDVLPVNGHKGPVNVLLYDHQGRILSAGADGFLGIWDISANAAVEHFQLSPFSIISMVLRPNKPEIALIEWSESGLYRISAWNYETKKNLFIRFFKEPLSYINYSGGGNFLIVIDNNRTGAFFINAETGDDISSPLSIRGTVTFAATGRSERTMIAYLPSGSLSYWELESGNEIRRLPVPPNILSPVLMGNNNFFAGFDSGGLVIVNALSGDIIAREPSLLPGILVPEASETLQLLCFSADRVYYFSLTSKGALERVKSLTVSIPEKVTSVLSAGKIPVLGGADGKIRSFDSQGRLKVMTAADQLTLRDAAVSGGVLAFIGEVNNLGFLPLDYTAIKDRGVIQFETARNYTNITPEPEVNPGKPGKFIFWRSDGDFDSPMVKNVPVSAMDTLPPDVPPQTDEPARASVTRREPLLSVSMLADQVLSLDTNGNITVTSLDAGNSIFSFSSQGALDAAFLDPGNIIIGRSAGSGGTPFLKVNLLSGETVPLAYPVGIGARVYRGLTGTIYGGVAALVSGTVKNGIIKLDVLRPDRSMLLTEYQGEDTGFDMAECNGALASTLGKEWAVIHRDGAAVPFERTSGLPIKLIGGINYFLAIDREGSITWYDPESGAWRALLRMYEKQWFLEKADGSVLTGTIKTDS